MVRPSLGFSRTDQGVSDPKIHRGSVDIPLPTQHGIPTPAPGVAGIPELSRVDRILMAAGRLLTPN
jgi:hypothetical protein